MTIKDTRAYEYAKWCISDDNEHVGTYVKKQCRAWLDIVEGKNEEAFVNEKKVAKICKILKLMVHPDLKVSMLDGLEDYAILLILAVFCTVDKKSDTRYYRTALLKICRKNFKTFTSAVIFIIAMLTEPRFSRFFSVAPDLKLSKELQVAINKIIKSSPHLNGGDFFKILRSEIRCLITESEYTPLAYSQDKMDGKLAAMFLGDEAGAMDAYPIEAMRSSQITLKNKLGIIISTEYPSDNNVLIDETDRVKKILDGLLDDKRYFALLFEPDIELQAGDLWKTDDRLIYQANPIAESMPEVLEELKSMRALAVLYPNKRENFLCKHLNVRYKSLGVSGYVDVLDLRKCKVAKDDSFWRGRRVYLGMDLSHSCDNTTVAMVTEVDGFIYAKVWGFVPKDRVELKSKQEGVDYKKLIKNGECFACGDAVIDYAFVENFVLSLEERYGVEAVQLGFDRWNALSSVQKIEAAEKPIECVEIRQHSSILHAPTKLLQEKILQKKFRYEENQLLEINFQNARCTEDSNLNKYVNKKKSTGKVDMVLAVIMAIYLLEANGSAEEAWGGAIL